jgi:solute carrier family 27 (fatty acid transporter), member 1/4
VIFFKYSAAVRDVRDSIPADCRIFQFSGSDQNCKSDAPGFENLNQQLSNEKGEPISGLPRPKYDNELIYIYTSGTTGLPKAAVMKTSRCAIKLFHPI